jgi:hypothetical protein
MFVFLNIVDDDVLDTVDDDGDNSADKGVYDFENSQRCSEEYFMSTLYKDSKKRRTGK